MTFQTLFSNMLKVRLSQNVVLFYVTSGGRRRGRGWGRSKSACLNNIDVFKYYTVIVKMLYFLPIRLHCIKTPMVSAVKVLYIRI